MSISESDLQCIEQLLGREPRGLQAVAVRDNEGVPMVLRVASLVEGKPFPTMFWLIDKRVNYAIDQVEARGLIAQLQEVVNASPDLQADMERDHLAHIEQRLSYMSDEEKAKVESLGFMDVLSVRGIGGIADFHRIRCLHTYYASHLVQSNTVGRLLDEYWREAGVVFPHIAIG